MAIRTVIITEVIEHEIEIETKKDWRHAEEIALDYLSLLRSTDEAAETVKLIVSHQLESKFSLQRMTEFATVDLAEEQANAKYGTRIAGK